MVIDDVPIITPETRSKINEIIEQEFRAIEGSVNPMLSYPPGSYAHTFDYHNVYVTGKNNVVYLHDKTPVMCAFEFSLKSQVKLYKLLNLSEKKPIINAIRVYPYTTVPMHIDLNKGGIGREYPIYSIVVSGIDGCVYMSNKNDGSRQVAIPGLTQFVMCPNVIAHGATSKSEPYTLFQIQLKQAL